MKLLNYLKGTKLILSLMKDHRNSKNKLCLENTYTVVKCFKFLFSIGKLEIKLIL
jgi:hypothetical protein